MLNMEIWSCNSTSTRLAEFVWSMLFQKYKEKYGHTWRSCGTDGAGRENLPRATTA